MLPVCLNATSCFVTVWFLTSALVSSGSGRSCNKAKDQAHEDKPFGPCITIFTDHHEDPFITIKNQVYNDTLVREVTAHYVCQQPAMCRCRSLLLSHTNFLAAYFHSFCSLPDAPTCGLFSQGLSNEDATALAMLLGTVSLQHDNYLPWWRENTASSVEQPSRSKTVFAGESDGNASDTDDDNDNAGEFCSGDYYKMCRGYYGPHVEDLNTQVAALIAQGKQALKNLRIQDGECAFECATKGKLTPEHFCQAGRMAWDQGMPHHCLCQHTFLVPPRGSCRSYLVSMLAWHSDPALGSSHDSCLFAVWFALMPMRKKLLRVSAGESKLALQLFYFQETLKAKLQRGSLPEVSKSCKHITPICRVCLQPLSS